MTTLCLKNGQVFDPINKIQDIDDNDDVKLDYCITPTQVHKFDHI